jgi:hypothetical protein
MELTRENQHIWDDTQIEANSDIEEKKSGDCVFTSFSEIHRFKEMYPKQTQYGYETFLNTKEGIEAFNKFRGKN